MFKYLTALSFAELLTTLAAWGGLFISVFLCWQQHRIKLSVAPILSIPAVEGGRILCTTDGLQSVTEELITPMRRSIRLAIRITNMRQFPVFVENYGFSKNKQCKNSYVGIKNGTYVAKFFENTQIQYVTIPFALKPLESVTIEINDFLPSRQNLQRLIDGRFDYAFAQVTNGYVKTTNVREFCLLVQKILNVSPKA